MSEENPKPRPRMRTGRRERHLSEAPRHAEFLTSDVLEAREFIDHAYGASLKVAAPQNDSPCVHFDQVEAGEIVLSDLDLPLDLDFRLAGRGEYVFTTLLAGTAGHEEEQGEQLFAPGDLYLGMKPDGESHARSSQIHSRTLGLPATLLEEVARTDPEGVPDRLELDSIRPVSGGDRRWRSLAGVVESIFADPDAVAAPLVVGHAARLVAATALSIFPHTTAAGPIASPGPDAHPATLRRAVAFIEAHPAEDITLLDVGRAAYATPRTVQLAFRRHLDTTPMAYLRTVRLGHAHRALEDAGPGGEVTVARVALDWGFANAGRFAAYYREAYGRPPSRTLAG